MNEDLDAGIFMKIFAGILTKILTEISETSFTVLAVFGNADFGLKNAAFIDL